MWQFSLLKYSFYKEDYMAVGNFNSAGGGGIDSSGWVCLVEC
nr:MAG TPA: hypothetical protein [Caudoviricetes sp.]